MVMVPYSRVIFLGTKVIFISPQEGDECPNSEVHLACENCIQTSA